MTQVAFTRVSGNKKTGAIPTTISERSTCSTTCPFYAKGCYAKGGPLNIHWKAVTEKRRGGSWDELLKSIKNLPKGKLWRHNVAGDLPHVDGVITDELISLARANTGRKGFTYTHHTLNKENIEIIKQAIDLGFTVNISTESVEKADRVMNDYNLPAVAVVSSDETRRNWKTEKGRKVLKCPATSADHMTCEKCGLCSQSGRDYIIAFPAHGAAKKTVNTIIK